METIRSTPDHWVKITGYKTLKNQNILNSPGDSNVACPQSIMQEPWTTLLQQENGSL